MKYLLILLLFYSFLGVSQTQYDIETSGTTNDDDMPVACRWGYMRNAYIYEYSDFTSAGAAYGTVTHLSWQVAAAGSVSIPFKIYLKETSSTSVAADTWSNTISGATLVYNSSNSFTSTGWIQFDITDFEYSANNLMVLVETNYGGSGSFSGPEFETLASSTGRVWRKDYTAPTDNGIQSGDEDNKPNLKMTILSCPTAVWDGSSSTDWNTAANWDINAVPCGDVTLADVANDPEIGDFSVSLANLTINSGAVLTYSTSDASTFYVSGNIVNNGTLTQTSSNFINITGSGATLSGTGTQTTAKYYNRGTYTLNDDWSISQFNQNTGTSATLTVSTGNTLTTSTLYNDDDCTLTIAGTGAVTVSTTMWSEEGATFNSGTGTLTCAALNLNGGGTGGSFNIQSGGTLSVSGTANIDHTLTVSDGATAVNLSAVDCDGTMSIGNATVNVDGDLDATNGTIDFTHASGKIIASSTVTSLGDLDAATGTFEYDGGTQNVVADAYYNLEIDAAGTKTAQGTITVAGTMTVQSAATYAVATTTNTVTGTSDIDGTLSITTGTYNADGASDIDGTLSISSTGTYDADGAFDATNGNVTFTGAGTVALASLVTSMGTLSTDNGTVKYDGGTQTIRADTYYNLTVDQSGTKTPSSHLDVDGDLVVSNSAKLDMSIYDLNIAGNINIGVANGSDFAESACMVTFDGTGDQSFTHSGNSSTTTDSGTNLTDYAIPDESYTESDITLSSSLNATDLKSVTINISHAWIEDVDIRLYSPNGDYIDLSSDNGGSGDHYTNTVFETGGADITAASAPFTGTYAPEEAFSNLSGTANGTWTLRVYDDYDLITGTLLDWSITVEASNGVASELTNCTINKASGDVDLSSAIEIDGTVTLTSGFIDASSNTLTFADAGAISGGNASAHIKGTIVKKTESTSAFTFPIGDGTEYEPLTITPNSTNANTWQLTYTKSDHGDRNMGAGMDHVSWKEYWDLSRTSGSDGVTIAFNWDSDDGVTDYANLTVGHFTGGNWEVVASTPSGNNTSGTLTTDAAVTSFSPFTKGSTVAANVLPVELISFEAECKDAYTDITWLTASELNNDYFLLEKSQEEGEFKEIYQIPGAGTSIEMNEYSYNDYDYTFGTTSYRLSQFDFDGESRVYNPIFVNCSSNNNVSLFNASASRLSGYLTISSDALEEKSNYTLLVYTIDGKQVYHENGFTETGVISKQIDMHEFSSGVYLIHLYNGNSRMTKKAIW